MAGTVLILETPQLDAMRRSLADFERLVLLASEESLQFIKGQPPGLFLKRLVAGEKIGDLIFAKSEDAAASGARLSHILQCNPTDEYHELFAAFAAAHGNACTVVSHGWPVLSLVSDNPSMTEGGAESICAAGGR